MFESRTPSNCPDWSFSKFMAEASKDGEAADSHDIASITLDVNEDETDFEDLSPRSYVLSGRLQNEEIGLRPVRTGRASRQRLDRTDSVLDVIEHPNDWGATYSDRNTDRETDRNTDRESNRNTQTPPRRGEKRRGGGGGDDAAAAAASTASERELTRLALRIAILEKTATGIGTLAFVWATVVLLGGFAVLLEQTDFYFVTAIVLIEGTRVFTRNHELDSGFFFRATKAVFEPFSVSRGVGWILTSLQLLSATACAVLSLMRLAKQRFGEVERDATKRNRAPALDIFYGLALAQALLFLAEKAYWHWKISYRKLLEQTCRTCGFGPSGIVSLRRFFHDVYWKCISGGVFDALDTDLTAFALVLINSDSRGERLIGARILHSYAHHERFAADTTGRIMTSAQTVRRLIAMLGWKSPADGEIRLHAARIVARLAGDKRSGLRVIGIPGAMQSIASLLHAARLGADDQDQTHYEFNMLGLHILKRLAGDVGNCRQIRNARGLLSKIVEFTTTSPSVLQNEQLDGHPRIKLVKRSLKVVMRLASTAGKTGRLLRRDISDNIFTVSSIRDILRYGERYPALSTIGIEILTGLAIEKAARKKIGSTGGVIELLLSTFLRPSWTSKAESGVILAAGDALAMLATESRRNCAEILKGSEDIVTRITDLLKVASFRVSTLKLLQNLYIYAGPELYNHRGAVATALSYVSRAIMKEKEKLLEVSISLSVQICKLVGPEEYGNVLYRSCIEKIELVDRLVEILRRYDNPTVELPRIRRFVVEQAIWMMKSDRKYIDLFKACGMAKELEIVGKTTSELEYFMHFSGSVGVNKYRKPIDSLVKTAAGLIAGT